MIHYHGLPLTPIADMAKSYKGRHAMVSFENPEQLEAAAEICQSVVLDNGAFSAWRQGKNYDFEGYYEWAGHWLKHPAVEWAVIPDIIDGDEEANEKLVSQWPFGRYRGCPVWHLHEGLERLRWLCSVWPRVALGSSGEYSDPGSPVWWERIARAMRICCDDDGHPHTKLHGLRMLDPVIFSHLPLTSADSCNVARNVGIDGAWEGAYTPRSRSLRALIMMDRIEAHASARRWNKAAAGVQSNLELMG